MKYSNLQVRWDVGVLKRVEKIAGRDGGHPGMSRWWYTPMRWWCTVNFMSRMEEWDWIVEGRLFLKREENGTKEQRCA